LIILFLLVPGVPDFDFVIFVFSVPNIVPGMYVINVGGMHDQMEGREREREEADKEGEGRRIRKKGREGRKEEGRKKKKRRGP
jgi:hypothetical protein